MDAPFWELIIRFLTAIVAGYAFISVYALWKDESRVVSPIRHISGVMTAWLGALFVNRVYIFWLGTQSDIDGSYARDIEPIVRAIGASLLALVLFTIGLIATFHILHMRNDR